MEGLLLRNNNGNIKSLATLKCGSWAPTLISHKHGEGFNKAQQ